MVLLLLTAMLAGKRRVALDATSRMEATITMGTVARSLRPAPAPARIGTTMTLLA